MTRQNRLLILLALISLIFILGLIVRGLILGKYSIWLRRSRGFFVLGITDKISSVASDKLENIMESTAENASREISRQLSTTEGRVKEKLEKEISGLAKSQIDAFKFKVCRAWGGIPPSRTATSHSIFLHQT